MRSKTMVEFLLLFLLHSLHGQAQLWTPILSPNRAIDWSKPGVGRIPARGMECTNLTSWAILARINPALTSCPSSQSVYLAAGTYSITGTIGNPSKLTLRGAGASGHFGTQTSQGAETSSLSTKQDSAGIVVGSAQVLPMDPGSPLVQKGSLEYLLAQSDDGGACSTRPGYLELKENFTNTVCREGSVRRHFADTSSTSFFHGNCNDAGGPTVWAAGVTQTFPPSFYLSRRPSWREFIPFPATGPDRTGGTSPGGHSFGISAQACYSSVMGGSDGRTGGPLIVNTIRFNGSGRPAPQPPTGLTATVRRAHP